MDTFVVGISVISTLLFYICMSLSEIIDLLKGDKNEKVCTC